MSVCIAGDAFLVTERFLQRLTERDAHIFCCVMGVNMQVPFDLDLHIDQRMA